MSRGSRGDSVRQAQRALVLHGGRLKIDGVYGSRTQAAVRAFQRRQGLPVTGRLDDATQARLNRPLQRGDRGPAVRQLQHQLNQTGSSLRRDGRFGPNTEDALKSFQGRQGVEQTGTLNSQTFDKLLTATRKASGTQAAGKGGKARADLIAEAKRYLANNPSNFRSDVLVVCDFTQHQDTKRFFVVDLSGGSTDAWKTSHGRGSDPKGVGKPQTFSNVAESFQSSIGFYRTAETYHGKFGYSLRIDGLEDTNNRARKRAVVIHPSKNMREGGRSTTSRGCFVLDSRYSKEIIDKIKGGALLYAYGGQEMATASSTPKSGPR